MTDSTALHSGVEAESTPTAVPHHHIIDREEGVEGTDEGGVDETINQPTLRAPQERVSCTEEDGPGEDHVGSIDVPPLGSSRHDGSQMADGSKVEHLEQKKLVTYLRSQSRILGNVSLYKPA